MNAHMFKTAGRQNRAAIVLAGALVAGLSACGAADETSTQASATSTPAETSSSAPATSSAPPESETSSSTETSSPETSSPETSSSETSSPATSSPEAPAEEYVITIKDFEYTVPDSVPAGATVMVVNEDAQAHTVTAKGKFDVNVGPNATGEFVAPEEMGEEDFICIFHGNMKDTLVIS